jgi:serine/threonine protein phosphatase PrpC
VTVCIGGTAGIRGKRAYMEDMEFSFGSINVLDKYNVTMFGVLDGHGGQECAKYGHL